MTIAKVKITYYRDLEAMKKDEAWDSYEFDLDTKHLAELEKRYDITPVTGEKKEAEV